jgi:hypothetical protein
VVADQVVLLVDLVVHLQSVEVLQFFYQLQAVVVVHLQAARVDQVVLVVIQVLMDLIHKVQVVVVMVVLLLTALEEQVAQVVVVEVVQALLDLKVQAEEAVAHKTVHVADILAVLVVLVL